ncbi:TadE family protein [Sphingobium sp. TomMM35A]|jgi:Flp pilus assembly protein TadG
MAIHRFNRLLNCNAAAAAAEMALITPLLITLMFGSFELGNYFLSEHVVVKAVRDGARFAARQPFSNFDCSAGTIAQNGVDDLIVKTKNLTRTGQIADGGLERLRGWTDPSTVSVTLTCLTISSGNYSGIYKDMTSVPKVKVSAVVPYNSLFNNLGFTSASLNLVSESEAPVQGI